MGKRDSEPYIIRGMVSVEAAAIPEPRVSRFVRTAVFPFHRKRGVMATTKMAEQGRYERVYGHQAVSRIRAAVSRWRSGILVLAACSAVTLRAVSPANAANTRVEALIEADRSASSTIWKSGLQNGLREAFELNAVLLVPGAPVLTAGALLVPGTDLNPPVPLVRLSWDALGVRISNDSSIGMTWGVAMNVQESMPPSMGRYVAVWRHGGSGWRIVAYSLLGVSPSARKEWNLFRRTIPDTPTEIDTQRFYETDREFARAAADGNAVTAFRTWAAPDAIMFGRRGFMITGPDMIGKAVEGPARWSWEPVVGGGSGDLGWTVGEAVIAPDQAPPVRTKYLSVWRTSADGSLRFIMDAGSVRP